MEKSGLLDSLNFKKTNVLNMSNRENKVIFVRPFLKIIKKPLIDSLKKPKNIFFLMKKKINFINPLNRFFFEGRI